MPVTRQPCPLCGSQDARIVATVADYTVPLTNVCCERCGLVFADPFPASDQLAAYYRSEFIQGRHRIQTVVEARERAARKGSAAKYSAEGLADGLASGSRVLEIGCSYGFLLDAVRKAAQCHVEGVEPSEVSARFAREELGVPVFRGTVEQYLGTPVADRFDLIIISHVLEHLADPVGVLRSLERRLAPRGRLYVCVPDVTHLQEPPETFFQVPHLVSFSPWTLHLAFSAAGLKIIRLHRKLRAPKSGMEAYGVRIGDPVDAFPHAPLRIGCRPRAVAAGIRRARRLYGALRAAKNAVRAVPFLDAERFGPRMRRPVRTVHDRL